MSEARVPRAAWIGLAVLSLLNLLNYLDRYVVSALVESLKRSDLALSDAQLGSLMSAFVIVYVATSPVFGVLGDRGRRPRLLALGVAIWSVATAVAGFARSFGSLFAARAVVGVGEGAYGTIAPALLSDAFPPRLRGRVFSVFFAAIPIGSAAGYILGGLVDQRFGWRAAFFLAGLPGLLLALSCVFLRDPPRGGQDGAETNRASERISVAAAWRELLRNRLYVLTVAGYAAYTFALGALAFWMPAFLERVRGVPKAAATVQFGAIVVTTGFLGTFAGGWLGDALRKRHRQAELLLSGATALAAAPVAAVAFAATRPAVYLPAIVVAELLLFASTGPVNAVSMSVVPAALRARASGLLILAIHLFGDVPSPPLIGAISDATSLRTAFWILPAAIALAGGIWLYAARTTRVA